MSRSHDISRGPNRLQLLALGLVVSLTILVYLPGLSAREQPQPPITP